jgi:hypothetical protein
MSFISAQVLLAFLISDPCVSEVRPLPAQNTTLVFKCKNPGHNLPIRKDQTRIETAEPKQEVLTKVAKPTKKKRTKKRKRT